MRLLPSLVSVLALAVLSLAATPLAHANSYTFSFSGQDGELEGLGTDQPYTETFTIDPSVRPSLPANDPGFTCATADCFTTAGEFGDYNLQRDGVIAETGDPYQSLSEYIYLFTDSALTNPLTLFTGSSANPTIATGNFYAGIYFPGQSFSPDGTISIVDPPSIGSSPVPEPSTLALLGTGALGLAGTLRRRFLA